MKYLILLLILLSGCATAKPTPESCMRDLRKKIESIDHTKLKQHEDDEFQIALYYLCLKAQNDPELAYKIGEWVMHQH